MGSADPRGDRALVFRTVVLRVLLPSFTVLLIVLAIAYWADVPLVDLLRDPAAVADEAKYVGIVSTTGVALWAVSGALCLLALTTGPEQSMRRLLVAGAVTSLLLGADDAYLIHETLKNTIGIPSAITLGIYGVVALVLFWPVRGYLMSRSNVGVFGLALFLLGMSAVVDLGGESGLFLLPGHAVVEDLFKFLGIVTWTTFFAGVSRYQVNRAVGDRSAARPTASG